LRDVVDKLGFKHHVEIDEVEEVLCNKPKFRFVEKGKRKGENVYLALGQTIQINKRSSDIKCKRYGQEGKETI